MSALFSTPTVEWFTGAFDEPTAAQWGAWDAIARDHHAVVVAPTGSGKTLAAFLWAIDKISARTEAPSSPLNRCSVLYVSPLKALATDVERNLRAPLRGIEQAIARTGGTPYTMQVGVRTGDTPPSERRRFGTHPPDILITTPESLFLILTSQARSGLSGIDTVIIDEVHSVAGTKRGAHLSVSLERLDAFLERPARRIGLSATVEPVDAVSDWLAGGRSISDGGRPVTVVAPPVSKKFDISVEVPLEDLNDPQQTGEFDVSLSGDAAQEPRARASVWPHVEERIVDLVQQHTTTLVFTNARRGAERLTARMNEIAARRSGQDVPDAGSMHAAAIQAQSGAALDVDHVIARAHHGSMSRSERSRTESDLKNGVLPCVVATSSLELGIDMGSIDLVVQVGPPPSAASGLQRVGRAGHSVGAVSRGRIFPVHRGELVPAAIIAQRMRTRTLEPLHRVANPLDVLAQQIVAMLAVDDWDKDELFTTIRRSAPFMGLGHATFVAVLDMLAGRYPSEDFGELRARIVWDRATNLLTGRPGALRLAATSGGTIPDRGLYGVFLVDSAAVSDGVVDTSVDDAPGVPRAGKVRLVGGKRVGELDEEMVYESRVGDVFTLGSSTWRIEEITPDRVLVSPAPGVPGRLPFWKGDGLGRSFSLGVAIGQWLRRGRHDDDDAVWAGLDERAASNLRSYLREQEEATGVLPTDDTIVVERFRDELGDWRVVIHTPFGARVHAPWALVIGARLRERYGFDTATMHSDDGIVIRLPAADDPYDVAGAVSDGASENAGGVGFDDLMVAGDAVESLVREHVADSSLFAARFREAAGRALLLPRARPDRRQPLWQQRQRSAQLLSVAAQFPDFPIVLEAVRECLQDDYDVPALRSVMERVEEGTLRVVEVTTPRASPFAQTLLFGYTAQFIYDSDAPLAERRAAALTLDPTLLAELLGASGSGDLADLLDEGVVEKTALELAGVGDRRLRHAEDVWDFLQRWGPITVEGLGARWVGTDRDDLVQVDPHHLNRSVDALSCPDPRGVDWARDVVAELVQSRRVFPVRLMTRSGPREYVASIADAGRLRDALGVAIPPGIADEWSAPVRDPLGDMVRRYAKTHVPFTVDDVAERFGVGRAVVFDVVRRLVASGVVVAGRLLPSTFGGVGDEYCDADVMRVLRRRSLAALRADVEPVVPSTLAVFLPQWHRLGELRGVDGTATALEQLVGAPIPVSTLEADILPARVVGYRPEFLDELMVGGEVMWVGHRSLSGLRGGRDGIVSFHDPLSAHLTLPAVPPLQNNDDFVVESIHRDVWEVLENSGGFFAHQLAAQLGCSFTVLGDALWDLVWAGYVTNDSFAPLRALLGRQRAAPRSRSTASRRPRRLGSRFEQLASVNSDRLSEHPTLVGRWSAVARPFVGREESLAAWTTVLLDRYGVITRSVLGSEDSGFRFTELYRALSHLETTGALRRGYFVEHLGGSQFAAPLAVDALRVADTARSGGGPLPGETRLLSVWDPAQPYGSTLAWPDSFSVARPTRRAGAHVVIHRGECVCYVDHTGRSVVFAPLPRPTLDRVCTVLREAVDDGRVSPMKVSKINGVEVLALVRSHEHPDIVDALTQAGWTLTPSGLSYRGRNSHARR